jgi:predicted O-methyltransferase YrrM
MVSPIIEHILTTNTVTDASGKTHQLHAAISQEEGEFLAALITRHRFTRTLEVGCAYGISSLYICDALSRQQSPRHTIIDPLQKILWGNIGVNHLKRAGFDFYELIEKRSEIALPALLEQGRQFQFTFIDGWHTFDHTLLDFFYVNRLLEEGGVVAIDDVQMPAVRKAIRYISNYPNYRIIGAVRQSTQPSSRGRMVADAVLRSVSSILPKAYGKEVFADSWLRPDSGLGIQHSSLVAFEKTGPDKRSWDWYIPF